MKTASRKKTPYINVKTLHEPPYVIDRPKLQRYDRERIIFERVASDPSWEGYNKKYDEKALEIIEERKPGYSRVDFALAYASWVIHDAFEGSFSWQKIAPHDNSTVQIGIDWTGMKHEVSNPREMSKQVKQAAKSVGASLTGICKLNPSWLYKGVEIPENIDNAIVLGIEMDEESIAASPAIPAAIATGVGYSKMGFVLALLGEFIRNLGYKAIQCGNDTALSIPIAIDAGLGELGRNGLLITPKYGPRIRLCKILTDLPLEADRPIEFDVRDFCKKCKLCAKNCEAEAISMRDGPGLEVACRSNNHGATKWYVDTEKCYLYWCENGASCSTCIAVCPYNTRRARAKTPLS